MTEEETPPRPFGSISAKDSNLCMTLHCACGRAGHVDTDFFYWYRCTGCGTTYQVGSFVKLVPLSPEEVKELEERGATVNEDPG